MTFTQTGKEAVNVKFPNSHAALFLPDSSEVILRSQGHRLHLGILGEEQTIF